MLQKIGGAVLSRAIDRIIHVLYRVIICKPTFIKNLSVSRNTHVFVKKSASLVIENQTRFNYPDRYDIKTDRGIFSVYDNASVHIGSLYALNGAKVEVGKNAVLDIGNNVTLNRYSRIYCLCSISIGSDVAIGEYVLIRDTDGHRIVGSTSAAPITIGNHVWIGAKATILNGVKIGDGAVIGANSVVTKSIPPNCLAVGSPAKVIRENISWIR